LPIIPTPHTDANGNYDAASLCEAEYSHFGPPIPYGPENEALDPSTLSEDGFKNVRGYLTEGRYLVLEMNGYALTNPSATATDFTATAATSTHSAKTQRWVLHTTGGTGTDGGTGSGTFTISSALDGRYIKSHTSLGKGASNAETYTIADLGNGQGYTLVKENGKYLIIDSNGVVDITGDTPMGFQVFSVTYRK
jgi:phospholipase C